MGDKNGNKKVEDLIEPGMTVDWNGSVGTPHGTVKYVAKYGEPYEDGEQFGHYFPIKFSEDLYGKAIRVGAQNGVGGKVITPDEEDPYLIIRIENVTVDDKITAILEETGEEVFTVDFSKVLLPNVAVMAQDEHVEYGEKPVSEIMGEDVKIAWNGGTTGYVMGTFPMVTGWTQLPGKPNDGHFFALRIDQKFLGKPFTHIKGNEEGTTVQEATQDEMFWVLNIDDRKKHTFKSGDTIIAVLDFTGAVFKP